MTFILFLFFNISAFSGDNCCIKQSLKVIDFNSAGTLPTFLITKHAIVLRTSSNDTSTYGRLVSPRSINNTTIGIITPIQGIILINISHIGIPFCCSSAFAIRSNTSR